MQMEEITPFKFGKTTDLDCFTNRDEERKKIKQNLLSGINTMLISPRRWGKSSLVEKIVSELNTEKKNVKTVMLDVFAASNEEEFLNLFAREVIKKSSKKWEDWMKSGKEFFKAIVPKISLGIDPINDFEISFDWEELKKNKDEILNLPERIAQLKNIKYIICIDEFQQISEYEGYEHLEKKMRSVWQKQQNVSYCLYGSKRHMMTEIFNKPSKPFYRFGDIILLQKIKTESWVSFIVTNFKKTNKSISKKEALFIVNSMRNHSWYVQQFSSYVWNKTKTSVTQDILNDAIEELVATNMPLFMREIEILSVTQVNFLKAVSQGENKLTSTAVMQKYHLGTPRNVSKNKQILTYSDMLNFENGEYEFLDPVFELWFKKVFFRQDFLIK
jgi:uncharacterized protein